MLYSVGGDQERKRLSQLGIHGGRDIGHVRAERRGYIGLGQIFTQAPGPDATAMKSVRKADINNLAVLQFLEFSVADGVFLRGVISLYPAKIREIPDFQPRQN